MSLHILNGAILLLVGLAHVLPWNPALAGTVSLTDPQRAKLKALIESDAEAAARFAEVQKDADAALTAEPNPIHHILSEGKLKNDPDKIRTGRSMQDMARLRALGYA